MLVSITDHKLH